MISAQIPPQSRDVYWVPIEGVYSTDKRVSVVTRVEADYVELIYGQGTRHCGKDVEVLQSSVAGQRLKLTKDTYFRCMNVLMVKRTYLPKFRAGICPVSLYLDLDALVIEQRRQGTIGWQPPIHNAEDLTPPPLV